VEKPSFEVESDKKEGETEQIPPKESPIAIDLAKLPPPASPAIKPQRPQPPPKPKLSSLSSPHHSSSSDEPGKGGSKIPKPYAVGTNGRKKKAAPQPPQDAKEPESSPKGSRSKLPMLQQQPVAKKMREEGKMNFLTYKVKVRES